MERRSPLTRAAHPARVLIAEDHFDSRTALGELLNALGYEVLEATNGREAVEVAGTQLPDIVLMDMMMPEMDGFEATRVLRGDPRTRTLPIIAVTAMEGARDIALGAGANDFVAKPVDSRLLLSKIEKWLTPETS